MPSDRGSPLYNCDAAEKLRKCSKNVPFFNGNSKLICFEWQCNLFENVQVLQTWELRLFYRESFVEELCEIHSFPVATNLKIIN